MAKCEYNSERCICTHSKNPRAGKINSALSNPCNKPEKCFLRGAKPEGACVYFENSGSRCNNEKNPSKGKTKSGDGVRCKHCEKCDFMKQGRTITITVE